MNDKTKKMALNFEKMGGILPAIIQDAASGDVLMLGFMNREAYEKTLSEGRVSFYSRTRERLWTKGEESGNYLNVVEIREDCDRDTLLVRVDPVGPVCHTGERSCFGEGPTADREQAGSGGLEAGSADQPGQEAGIPGFLMSLEDLLRSRKQELPEGSYTSKLFRAGVNKIAQKLGEEAVELVIEAKDTDDGRLLDEAADLLFHLMILLVDRGYSLEDVSAVLEKRH
jgi:phosphoribosyl-ATP pyrophosphohydrolase/phosphoribosyl-AMP cyclohydrolase